MFKGRIAAAHGRFNCICQVVPMCTRSNTCFLGPTRVHIPTDISTGSAVFAQLTTGSPYTLQWTAPFPLEIAPLHGVSGPHLIHGSLGSFLGLARVHNPDAIKIGSAVFAGLTIVTDRPTTMWPNRG